MFAFIVYELDLIPCMEVKNDFEYVLESNQFGYKYSLNL